MAKSKSEKRAAKAKSKSVHKRIGDNVRRARVARGIKRQALADILGVTCATVGFYESGKIKIPNDRLIELVHHLQVSYEQILENKLPQDFRAGMPRYRYNAKVRKQRRAGKGEVVELFPRDGAKRLRAA